MAWYYWVIIGLSVALIGVSVTVVYTAHKCAEAARKHIIGPWLGAAFGKRH